MFLLRSCPGCPVGRPAAQKMFCGRCRASAQPVGPITGFAGIDGVGALFHYDGPVRRAVVYAKSGGRPDVFRAAGQSLADLASTITDGGEPPGLVTWVPASRRGRSARGFDQGQVMAKVIGRRLRMPARRVLASGRGSQLGRGRVERLASDGFRARGAVHGPVLLVDDVITTGASLISAAEALRAAGATSVIAVAVAWAASAEELAARRPLAGATTSGPFAPA